LRPERGADGAARRPYQVQGFKAQKNVSAKSLPAWMGRGSYFGVFGVFLGFNCFFRFITARLAGNIPTVQVHALPATGLFP